MTLFSLTKGTISATVPKQTISKYFKYFFLSNPSFKEIASISLNVTPTPASALNGYVLSGLFGSITAIVSGIFSGHS